MTDNPKINECEMCGASEMETVLFKYPVKFYYRNTHYEHISRDGDNYICSKCLKDDSDYWLEEEKKELLENENKTI